MIVKGVDCRIVSEFDVYYSGWECDSKGWLVETDKGLQIVMTSHGSPYFAKVDELNDHIQEYLEAINNMQNVISKINKSKD